MPDTVTIPIPIDADVAPALKDKATRLLAGRIVSRMLRPSGVEDLIALMDEISVGAERRGLTQEMLDEELAAYNAERGAERGTADAPRPA